MINLPDFGTQLVTHRNSRVKFQLTSILDRSQSDYFPPTKHLSTINQISELIFKIDAIQHNQSCSILKSSQSDTSSAMGSTITNGMNANSSLEDLQTDEQRQVLDTVSKIRKCGLESVISLPQIVVCGDQSSGKSSVLEALTEIPFPRSVHVPDLHSWRVLTFSQQE